MRKKITSSNATAIGARLKAARLQFGLSITELGSAVGVHHSQVSRCERGNFKTYGRNVQKLCNFLEITHTSLIDRPHNQAPLAGRFEALPGSAPAFARLFDFLEQSTATVRPKKRV